MGGKRKLTMSLLVVLIAFPAFFAVSVYATNQLFLNSYAFNYEFKVSLRGEYRGFDENNIRVSTTSREVDIFTNDAPTTFQFHLERKTTFGSERFGPYLHVRDGKTVTNFTNIPSGQYRIYLNKANDGNTVKGSGYISGY